MDVIPGRNLIVAGSKDHNVTLWTFDGGMLGMLGECPAVFSNARFCEGERSAGPLRLREPDAGAGAEGKESATARAARRRGLISSVRER